MCGTVCVCVVLYVCMVLYVCVETEGGGWEGGVVGGAGAGAGEAPPLVHGGRGLHSDLVLEVYTQRRGKGAEL